MQLQIETTEGELELAIPVVNKTEITQEVQKILAQSHYLPTPRKMLEFIDLTSLNQDDCPSKIKSLCLQAKQAQTAAVCVHPQFAHYCKQTYPEIQLAVVGLNFPWEGHPISLEETLAALQVPVDEVDMAINLSLVHSQQMQAVYHEIHHLAEACHQRNITLKVILESGTLENMGLIPALSKLSIAAGADFIKTSTGKTAVGATLEAAYLILKSIAESSRRVGLKPSGGIKTYQDALSYFQLTYELLGVKAIHPQRLRIGASSLVNELLSK